MVTNQELSDLNTEIKKLKEEKELKLKLAKSKEDRDQLVMEIKGLEDVGKSSKKKELLIMAGKRAGKDMKKGFKTIWKGIVKVSKNIERSDKQFAKAKRKTRNQPFSPGASMFLPEVRTPQTRKAPKRKKRKKGSVTKVIIRKKGGKTTKTITRVSQRKPKRKTIRARMRAKPMTRARPRARPRARQRVVQKEVNIWEYS